jgi:hypothetical protein
VNDYYDAIEKEAAIAFARDSVLAENTAYSLLGKLRAESIKEKEELLQEAALAREGLRAHYERDTREIRESMNKWYDLSRDLAKEVELLRSRTWWHLLKCLFTFSRRKK